jgi:hypothetical protein
MNYGKTLKGTTIPMSKPSAIERFTGMRTPASIKPQTAAEDAATTSRMVKKSKKAAAARSKIQTGNYASD